MLKLPWTLRTPAASAATSGADNPVLRRRLDRMLTIGEVIWTFGLIVFLIGTYILPAPVIKHDAFDRLIDVPPELVADLVRQVPADWQAVVTSRFAATPGWLAANGMTTVMGLVFIGACGAALRGRWRFYFILQALLLVPPELFGAAAFGGFMNVAVICAFTAGGRCLVKRTYRPLLPVGGAVIVILAWQGFLSGNAQRSPGLYFPEPAAENFAAFQTIETAIAAQAVQRPQAVAYVQAQIAYIRHDWARLHAMTPVSGRGFGGTPFKRARLAVLKEAQRALQPGAPAMTRPLASIILSQLTLACLVAGIVVALLTWRIKARGKRLIRLDAELIRLRRVTA